MATEHKKKVLIVHNYYQIPGGEDTVVANEKKLLEDHGHDVIFYSRDNSELKNMSKLRKICLPFTTIFNPRTYTETKQIIKKEEIDIVHVHNTLNLVSPAVYYAAVKCGVPVVQTIHNFRLICPGATFYRDGHICEDCVEKGLICAVKHNCYRYSKAQTLICVINTMIHRWTGIYGKINYICLTAFNREKLLLLNKKKQIIDPQKVYIKPNFTFETTQIDQGGVQHDYYLFIGRVEEIKGVRMLLDAFAELPENHLKVAGTGIELEKYKKEATENVSFLGFLNREELGKQIDGAKAIIVPSQWYETFGMIVAEAYAAHKAVIVGDIGNIATLVDDGVTGVKFKYDSVDALIEAIEKAHAFMGENGYEKYVKEFSPEANYKQLLAVYEAVR